LESEADRQIVLRAELTRATRWGACHLPSPVVASSRVASRPCTGKSPPPARL